MSINNFPFWEDRNLEHDEFLIENLEEDLFTASVSFQATQRMSISLIKKINDNNTGGEISFDIKKPGFESKYTLKEDSKFQMRYFKALKSFDKFNTSLYMDEDYNFSPLSKKGNRTIQLRLSHENLGNLSFGLQGMDMAKIKQSTNFSFYYINGLNFKQNNIFGGFSSGFNNYHKYLKFYKALVGFNLNENKIAGNIEFSRNRQLELNESGEKTISHSDLIKANLDINYNEHIKYASELTVKKILDLYETSYSFGSLFELDKNTKIKAKINSENNLIVGINHKINTYTDFGMVGNFSIGKTEKNNTFLKSKFGVSINFDDRKKL